MKKNKWISFFTALIGIGWIFTPIRTAARAVKPKPADLVLLHGKVVTMDPFRPHAEAVAISADTIRAVGSDRRIRELIGSHTRVINAKGMLVIPGFIEGHGHLMELGQSLNELDLRGEPTWSAIVQKVGKAAAEAQPGEWIFGQGWHQEKWDHPPKPNVNGWPTNTALSKVSPNNPVVLTQSSGHALIANKKALELAGITAETPNPKGGVIVRNKKGSPIGVLTDNAEGLVYKPYRKEQAKRSPKEVFEDRLEQFNGAVKDAISKGITSFKAQSNALSMIDFYRKLDARGKIPLRIYAMINEPSDTLAEALPKYRIVGHGNWFLTVRAIGEKLEDGALGSHTAHMLKPYKDLPNSTGTQVTSVAENTKTAELALKYGYQMEVHAIGDLANRQVLNIYQKVQRQHPGQADLRWEIEHAQHLNPTDIPRFARLGVIASMQSIHACRDAPFVVKELGKKRAREGAYAWHKLIDGGAVVTEGTDVPVANENPIPNFKCGVTRQIKNGKGTYFYPREVKTRKQELRDYTVNNAYSMFQEDHLGSITPGKLADITVLSQDIMTAPAYSIDSTKVVYTIIGGKVKYDHGAFENL